MAHLRTVKRNQGLPTRVSNPKMSIGAYDQSPHQHPYDSNSVASTLVVNTSDLNPRLTDASVPCNPNMQGHSRALKIVPCEQTCRLTDVGVPCNRKCKVTREL